MICDERSQYEKDRRERLKAAGICTHCGKRPVSNNHTICDECRANNRHREKVKRKERLKRRAELIQSRRKSNDKNSATKT